MKTQAILTFVGIGLLLSSCDLFKGHTEDESDNQEITSQEILQGIYVEMQGIRDSFSVQDTVIGQLILYNTNNPEGLDISIGNSPPISLWSVSDKDGQLVYASGGDHGCMVFETRLLPGDTLRQAIFWLPSVMTAFELPGGHYRISAHFLGNSLLMEDRLVKWVKIVR